MNVGSINTEGILPGIYFYELTGKNGFRKSGKVIKN